MRKIFTLEQLAFLTAGWKQMGLQTLTKAFNDEFGLDKGPNQILACLKNNRITRGDRPRIFEAARLLNEAEHQYLVRTYANHSRKEVTELFNAQFDRHLKLSQVVSYVKNHGINCGRSGHFVSGQISWNTGSKGLMKPNGTSFQKGQQPKNLRGLGSERICSKDGYVLVKIAETNPHTGHATRFKAKHVVVWEQHNGKVPKGHCIRFLDGNKENCVIENLTLVTRGAHALLNKKYKYNEAPAVFKPTLMLVAKLEAKAGARRDPPQSTTRAA